MPHDLTKVDPKLKAREGACRAIVETPKGRRQKLDYDPKEKMFRLKALLPDGMSFPMDFGFVPSTLADDGDPLDVMILADEPTPTATLLDIRLIGVIEAEEVENGKTERNDRVLAVAAISHLYASLKSVGDLEKPFIDNLVQFWTNKNRLEGKTFKCIGVRGPTAAVERVRKAMKRADKKA
ncbi:MAG: inorganic diphosphatase [Caulobacteraceae bacterium]